MRAALICLRAEGEMSPPKVAGRNVAQAQLDFALRCDCSLIVVHGHGGGAQAIELRHRAERAGARFQTITNAQALVGLLQADDILLVQQPGLWPDCHVAVGHLSADPIILVLPSGAGQQAGFERIDLDRAWAGALTMPAILLQKLDNLPEDIAPAPALLRIALQNRLAETRLPVSLIDDGSWGLLDSADDARELEGRWIRRVAGDHEQGEISQRMASRILLNRGGMLAADRRLVPAMLAGFFLLLVAAFWAAWLDKPAAGFALLALATPLVELLLGTISLRSAPQRPGRGWILIRITRDFVLAASVWLAIDGLWVHAAFAALVLVVALAMLDRKQFQGRIMLVRDRGVVALMVSLACLILPSELAIVSISSLLLVTNLMPDELALG